MAQVTRTPETNALMDYMSDISEEAVNARWMAETEYDLWRIVQNGPGQFWNIDITAEQIAELKRLSEASGTWAEIPLDEWREMYAKWDPRETGMTWRFK